ncbi:sensor histidine kinase [Bacteroides sp. K03]|uniref:tetratricopeptide repeat-containing sensor histidine kinase n=1 Tax=Bacteroides TaxID=816 RepID=UPI001C8CB44D|nr:MULTISPECIES: HAMP domain-containing sensor histidine kinase [Bacteroides]MBX9189071.1 sensor histidine kinase [Bacteroides sp. K03]
MLAGFLYSVPVYSVNNTSEHLADLQILIDNNLPYAKNITADSIILWEKELDPQLEKNKQYSSLFHLRQLVSSAYAIRGDITIAVDKAHTMYEKAKEMNYDKGIALSLRAIGDAYLGANMRQQAIDSYTEALNILNTSEDADHLKIHIFPNLILTLLKIRDTDKALTYLKQFEALFDKYPTTSTLFYVSICRAYYYVAINQPDKALIYITQATKANSEHNNLYMRFVLNYLYASYYKQSSQYDLALEKYSNLTKEINPAYSPNQHIQLNLQQAQLLSKLGQTDKACLIYQTTNILQDSLDNLSYVRQINELRTIYQIDQMEIQNQQERNQTILWGILVVLSLSILITVLIFHIRTENKRLRHSKEEQEKAQRHARNSIKTKSLFLSNMSHEIRTPLNALSGFSAILTDDSIDNETRRQCNDIIQQNSELLLNLINDVIDLSNLDMTKLVFNFKKCDAVVICRNVIDTVKKVKQTQADVHFVTTLESLPLLTDDSRLQQLLINLLINATKFTTEGSITLEIQKESDDTAIFSVTDTGCGIPLENQNRIFNRFEKLNEGAQGTGLGLSICQLIVEQIGGKIWIDPEYTAGARFMFTHPIKPDAATKNKKLQ